MRAGKAVLGGFRVGGEARVLAAEGDAPGGTSEQGDGVVGRQGDNISAGDGCRAVVLERGLDVVDDGVAGEGGVRLYILLAGGEGSCVEENRSITSLSHHICKPYH